MDPTVAVRSRREYVYLPNGQMGAILGTTLDGESYAISVRYDAEGHPITLSYRVGAQESDYELFWDDMDRLVAASIAGAHVVRWHYHYLGTTLIAATRERVETGGAVTVKRFWAISDERGLITRLVDEVGATHWQARWGATGWREIEGVPQPDMWVPFGFRGQIILDGTETHAGIAGTRPAIAVNHWRTYDPFVGAFLQPDPADRTGRLLPEGYLYGRGDYLGNVDPSGAETLSDLKKKIPRGWALDIDSSCDYESKYRDGGNLKQKVDLLNGDMAARIIKDIDDCKIGKCGDKFAGPNIKRQWKFALLTGKYYCARQGLPITTLRHTYDVNPSGKIVDTQDWGQASSYTEMGYVLGERVTIFGENPNAACWAQEVGHEALHGVMKTIPMSYIRKGPKRGKMLTGNIDGDTWTKHLRSEHELISTSLAAKPGFEDGLESCIKCR